MKIHNGVIVSEIEAEYDPSVFVVTGTKNPFLRVAYDAKTDIGCAEAERQYQNSR